MSQQYFSDSEWTTLTQAPIQAVLAVILSDKTDPVTFLKEAKAAIEILLAETERQDVSNDLVNSLQASLKAMNANETLTGEQLVLKREFQLLGKLQTLKSAAEGRNQALAHLQQVSGILAAKVTIEQARQLKDWLLSVARKVAEAVKEAGWLGGLGGEAVSQAEASTLSAISKALDTNL